MASSYKCQGIVIKIKNFGEADRLLTIFTDRFGKIIVKVKGVRKTLSRLSGHLDLFCLSKLILAEGRSLDQIISAEVLRCYPILGNNLQKSAQAFYLGELIDKFTVEKQENFPIFKLLIDVLEKLSIKDNQIYLRYFEVNLLNYVGLQPQINNCVICQEKLKPEKNYYSAKLGGILDLKCKKQDPSALPISVSAIKLLRLLQKEDINIAEKIKINIATLDEIKDVLFYFIRYLLEQKLVSIKFLETIKK